MGRDHPDYDGHVRECLGRQVRGRCRSRCRYHSSGAPPIAQTLPLSQHLHQIALFVIGAAGSLRSVSIGVVSLPPILGFGHRATWTTDLVPSGHQMTFKDALHILLSTLILKLALPDWARHLTKQTRKMDLAFIEIKVCYLVILVALVSFIPRTSNSNTCWKW